MGVFQIKRLAWKEALIARVDRHVHAVPVVPPGPAIWPTLTREAYEYKRLTVRGRFRHDLATRVHATTALGAGYWLLTPMLSEQGFWLLINRGFVPYDSPALAASKVTAFSEPETVIGLLRLTEPDGTLLQNNNPASGRWYSRDVQAMAKHQGLMRIGVAPGVPGAAVAPYFVDVVALPGQDPLAWPRPGLTVLHFNNNHLSYALTWFSLAAMTLAAMVYLLVNGRKMR